MQRFIGLIGIAVILLIAYALSNNKKKINYKTIGMALLLQVLFALFIFKVPLGQFIFLKIGAFIEKLMDFAVQGGNVVFGGLLGDKFTIDFCNGTRIFAIQLICSMILMIVLVNILYYYGIMQRVVALLGKLMNKVMKVSGAESLCAVANSFVGNVTAQIMIKPYLKELTRSELLTSMAGSLACVSGAMMPVYIKMGIPAVYILASSVMAAPGAIAIAKLMYPEDSKPKTSENIEVVVEKTHVNLIDSIAAGAGDGMKVAISITAMIIALVALVAMIDWFLGGFGSFLFYKLHLTWSWLPNLSLKFILGKIFAIFALVMGVPLQDITNVGGLIGEKIVLNEVVAYLDLTSIKNVITDKAFLISSFALCSFGNIGSIAIQIGGIGELAPEQRNNLAQLGFKALIAGTLTCFMSATIVGILF
ncbi:NupC/NupG family nucleoside CNT transporter [bacterium]|nr:NupC/NupG family nucleoside CNT transporter [bacterium]